MGNVTLFIWTKHTYGGTMPHVGAAPHYKNNIQGQMSRKHLPIQNLYFISAVSCLILPSLKSCSFDEKMPQSGKGSMQGSSSTKVVFHRRSSCTVGRLPPNVVFHKRLSSIKGCLPPKIVFHRRSSST